METLVCVVGNFILGTRFRSPAVWGLLCVAVTHSESLPVREEVSPMADYRQIMARAQATERSPGKLAVRIVRFQRRQP